MMKGGLGGGSKKEGKMRIRAFPVNTIFYFLLGHWDIIVIVFLLFLFER